MAEERDKNAPSLEPPSLFGRKKKHAPAPAPAEPVESPVQSPVESPVESRLEPDQDDSPTTILDDDSEPTPEPAPTAVRWETPTSPLTPPPAPSRPSEPRPPREPWLLGRPAAAMTGLLVGALIVAATAGSLRLCTAVKGTSSCGGQGFFLLVAILVVAVLVGAGLLRSARVPQPGSTSFLAVGLLSVAALLFLVDSIFQWWMVIVIPLVSVATFVLSHWLTTTYIEPDNDGSDLAQEPERHDIR